MTETKEIAVTSDGYRRWLRAQRPPWEFFFTASELEQEQFAALGEEHTEEVACVFSLIMTHSDEYHRGKGLMQGDAEAEESVAMNAAQAMARKLVQEQASQPASMAGIGSNIATEVDYEDLSQKPPVTLFGKEID